MTHARVLRGGSQRRGETPTRPDLTWSVRQARRATRARQARRALVIQPSRASRDLVRAPSLRGPGGPFAVMKGLWAGGEACFAGACYQLPPARTGPRPAQRPHPPLWVTGNSAVAIDRAACLGDGWHAIDLTPDELAPCVHHLRASLAVHGPPADVVTVSLRKGGLVGGAAARPLYGDRDAIRRVL